MSNGKEARERHIDLGAPPPEQRGTGLERVGGEAEQADPGTKGAERRSESKGREGLATGLGK